jgi:hypothetical protein
MQFLGNLRRQGETPGKNRQTGTARKARTGKAGEIRQGSRTKRPDMPETRSRKAAWNQLRSWGGTAWEGDDRQGMGTGWQLSGG